MTSWMKPLAGLALALSLSACAAVTAVPQGDLAVGADYSVSLDRQWSDISRIMVGRPPNVTLLSIDGPLLDRLYLTELAPGEFMIRPAVKEQPTPTVRAGMSLTEQVEFVTDNVAALGYQRVRSANLRPVTIAGAQGVRADISAETTEGLDISGTAVVVDRGDKLMVILYLAPREHYFAANLPAVEAVIASARQKG